MTNLALSLALQLAARSAGLPPFNTPLIPGPGVDLKQELNTVRHMDEDRYRYISDADQPKTIALTFDDGPHAAMTLKLLAMLKRLDVKATFFLVGKMVDRDPWLVRRELADGHDVGNHTYDHCDLNDLSQHEVSLEYRACSDAIQRAAGIRPRFCRPPGGRFDPEVLKAASSEGMWTVLWTDDPGDFARPKPSVILERAYYQLRNGGILLLHDGIPQTLQILPELVTNLRRRGFRFVTCSQLLAERTERLYAKHVAPSQREPETLYRRRTSRTLSPTRRLEHAIRG